jgi:predicted aspartyl protease
MTLRLAPKRIRGVRRMGTTTIRARLANMLDRARAAEIDMVVDSGAIYSVVPARVLGGIGVEPEETETFGLADGRSVKRRVGHVVFEIEGRKGISKVIFGRPDDASLLGMVTLELLGLPRPAEAPPAPLEADDRLTSRPSSLDAARGLVRPDAGPEAEPTKQADEQLAGAIDRMIAEDYRTNL